MGGEHRDWGWYKGTTSLFWLCSLLCPECSWCCLNLAALCFGVRVMICSGKHRAGVRISFLEDGEGSVLLTGGHGRVTQTCEAFRGRSVDNFGLGGDPGQETPQRQRQGISEEVGSSVRIHGNSRGGRSKAGGGEAELPFHTPLFHLFSPILNPPLFNASQSCC